ncbi:hypothetical protein EB796_024275 [Bugula neritina]|uniref:Uncharacterized protein n=1 Tax=Bugula neritina TaxID=10212 RepID=A0A7J7IUD6_BUGNE|nr:hypothetical protein EB796_024275 [Bugula neritina]
MTCKIKSCTSFDCVKQNEKLSILTTAATLVCELLTSLILVEKRPATSFCRFSKVSQRCFIYYRKTTAVG